MRGRGQISRYYNEGSNLVNGIRGQHPGFQRIVQLGIQAEPETLFTKIFSPSFPLMVKFDNCFIIFFILLHKYNLQ